MKNFLPFVIALLPIIAFSQNMETADFFNFINHTDNQDIRYEAQLNKYWEKAEKLRGTLNRRANWKRLQMADKMLNYYREHPNTATGMKSCYIAFFVLDDTKARGNVIFAFENNDFNKLLWPIVYGFYRKALIRVGSSDPNFFREKVNQLILTTSNPEIVTFLEEEVRKAVRLSSTYRKAN